jgi:hypothetical protein
LQFKHDEILNIEANPRNAEPTTCMDKVIGDWLEWAPGDARGSEDYATLERLQIAVDEAGYGVTALELKGMQIYTIIILKANNALCVLPPLLIFLLCSFSFLSYSFCLSFYPLPLFRPSPPLFPTLFLFSLLLSLLHIPCINFLYAECVPGQSPVAASQGMPLVFSIIK